MTVARLVAWACVNVGLGLFPSGVTYLAYLMHRYSQPVRLEELMFLVVMLVATTMMDMVVADWSKPARTSCIALLLLFFAVATVLYSVNIFSADSDSRDVLLTCGRALVGLAAMATISIQVFLSYHNDGEPA